jgi:hypothetical protein
MPLTQPYYLNGPSLASATAVFLDAAMTTCAPDGFYSDGLIKIAAPTLVGDLMLS